MGVDLGIAVKLWLGFSELLIVIEVLICLILRLFTKLTANLVIPFH
jgi:hypothetical protein